MRALSSLMFFTLLAAACGGGKEPAPAEGSIPEILTAQTFVALDPAQGQHPEGLIADGDGLLVGLAALGRAVRIDAAGQMTPAFELDPPFPPFNGSMADGSLLVTAQNAHQLVWVSPDGQTLRTLIAGGPLDQPANLILTGDDEVMLVNVAFFSPPASARPGVVRLTLGRSGEVLAQE